MKYSHLDKKNVIEKKIATGISINKKENLVIFDDELIIVPTTNPTKKYFQNSNDLEQT